MDDVWIVIGKISAVISIVAALFSWRQAWQARKSANQAQDIENRLQSFENYVDSSEIETSLAHAISGIKSFGHGCNKESIKGLDFQKALEATKTHIAVTRKYTIKDAEACETHCALLEDILLHYSSGESDEIKTGMSIFSELTKFQGFVNTYKRKNTLNAITGKNYD